MQHDMSSNEALTKHFQNMYGEMHHDRCGDKESEVGWQFANHGIWILASVGDQNEEIPGRMLQRGRLTYITVCNFHFRLDAAQKRDQARVILQSILRLCFRSECSIMTGDFNQSQHVIREIVSEIMEDTPGSLAYRKEWNIEWVIEYHHELAPEICLILIKYWNTPGWTFELDLQFDSARCGELGLDKFESDAHRPLTGHLVSTERSVATEHEYQKEKHQRSRAALTKRNRRRNLTAMSKPSASVERRTPDRSPCPQARQGMEFDGDHPGVARACYLEE